MADDARILYISPAWGLGTVTTESGWKILLTGKNGQVGWELARTLATLGEVIAVERRIMDLSEPDSIRSAIRGIKPDLIVNAAAYTAVDQAESEPDLAMAINGVAPGVMAQEAKRLGAALVHFSTDYVFDGEKQGPYTEEDQPDPRSVYGKTKLAGERAVQQAGVPHLIFRTSWVYGARGRNFLLTMRHLARERDALRIVDDQIGAPTWSRMIAEATAQILAPMTHAPSPIAEAAGLYHLTCAGQTSWYGFAQAILGSRPCADLIPIPTSEYPLPAKRPANSVLCNAKLRRTFGLALPEWDKALALCLGETD